MLLEKSHPKDPPGLFSQVLAWGIRLELVWKHLYFRVENVIVFHDSLMMLLKKILIKNKKAVQVWVKQHVLFYQFCLYFFTGNLTHHLPKLFRCQIFPAACCEMSIIPWKYFLSRMVYHQAFVKFRSPTDKMEFAWGQYDSLPHFTDKICFCPLWPM